MDDNNTEWDALADQYVDEEVDTEGYDFISEVESGVKRDEIIYRKNKKAKVGTKIMCAGPKCSNYFIKKSYQQCFCCNKHKNQFWNRRQYFFGVKIPII